MAYLVVVREQANLLVRDAMLLDLHSLTPPYNLANLDPPYLTLQRYLELLPTISNYSKTVFSCALLKVGEPSYEAVEVLLQHLCLRVPERAEPRQKTSEAILDIMVGLPTEAYLRVTR